MTSAQRSGPAKPTAQLPQGRYPVSPSIAWAVAGLVLLTGIALGVAVPHLASGPADMGTVSGSPEATDGGSR